MEKATRHSAEEDKVNIKSSLISELAQSAAVAQIPVRAEAILSRYVLCHFHCLNAEEVTEAGAGGRRTRLPMGWSRSPMKSQSGTKYPEVSWLRKEERADPIISK